MSVIFPSFHHSHFPWKNSTAWFIKCAFARKKHAVCKTNREKNIVFHSLHRAWQPLQKIHCKKQIQRLTGSTSVWIVERLLDKLCFIATCIWYQDVKVMLRIREVACGTSLRAKVFIRKTNEVFNLFYFHLLSDEFECQVRCSACLQINCRGC